jgi:hypothetical protein
MLFAVMFFGVSTLRVMPAVAMPAGMDMTMAAQGAPDTAPMPCKGMTPACMTDVGCIFMIGVAVPVASTAVDLAWAPVIWHWWPVEVAAGRARSPELRPPIRLV